MKKQPIAQPAKVWRITLRPGMVAGNRSRVKVFSSVTAFDGYVGALRAHGVAVSFATPFAARCAEAA